jgi:hypothetical protein
LARCGGGRQGWWEYRVDILEDLLPGELLHAAQEDDDEGLGRLEGDQTRESAHQRQDPPVVQHLAPRARSWYSAARRRGLSSTNPTTRAPRAEMAGEENRGTSRYGRHALKILSPNRRYLVDRCTACLVGASFIHSCIQSLARPFDSLRLTLTWRRSESSPRSMRAGLACEDVLSVRDGIRSGFVRHTFDARMPLSSSIREIRSYLISLSQLFTDKIR